MGAQGQVQRRPLVGCCVVFLVGTYLGLYTFHFASFTPLTLGALTLGAGTRAGWAGGTRRCTIWALSAVLFLAWGNACLHREHGPVSSDVGAATDGARVRVCGVVGEEPRVTLLRGDTVQHRFGLRTGSVVFDDGRSFRYRGSLRVDWFGYRHAISPRYGERWMFNGRWKRSIPGRLWGRSVSLVTGDRQSQRIAENAVGTVTRACYAIRRYGFDALGRGVADFPHETALMRALLLGARAEVGQGAQRLLRDTGTIHILAVSGLHVGIVAVLATRALSLLGISRAHWFYGLCPLLAGYTVASGARASAVRACVMALVFFAAPLFGRRSDSLSAVCLAAMGIVGFNVEQVTDIGFVYTFVVVSGLILLYPVLSRTVAQAIDRARPFTLRLPQAVVHETDALGAGLARVQGAMRWIGRHTLSLFLLSATSWLVSAPLTAYYFGRFTPVSLLSNVVVIPLAFLLVLTGSLSLVAGLIHPWFNEVFNHAGTFIAGGLLRLMGIIGHIPGGQLTVPVPALWMLAAWYAALGVLVLCARRAGMVHDAMEGHL
jgi:ComEC/Rec2-related protein